jgi:hypothetical protein
LDIGCSNDTVPGVLRRMSSRDDRGARCNNHVGSSCFFVLVVEEEEEDVMVDIIQTEDDDNDDDNDGIFVSRTIDRPFR